MKDLLTRAFDTEMVAEGRTLIGHAFHWNAPTRVADPGGQPYNESFDRSIISDLGSTGLYFAHPLAPKARTTAEPVGRVEYEDSDEGLKFCAEVFPTKLGNSVLDMIANGAIGKDVSVGFWPIKDRFDGANVVREQIRLIELSMLGADQKGAHPGAKIMEVRNNSGTPRLDRVRRKLILL